MMEGKSIDRDGYDYAQLTQGYHNSIKGLLESGCRVIMDNAWIDKDEIEALNRVLSEFNVLRVKVQCRLDVCESREFARGDRAIGLAKWEHPLVHQHMVYDITIDTSDIAPTEAAEQLFQQLKNIA